ncbi:mycofactocin biosynthesis peptidyl-dipeptidase MftE [Nocardioides sp. BYT-33-1]|uniref:mycofactocin biosynthesis peptidyl-dipeptidase MftE n=1 Tax=Nocardioides sp. BYT-33-1 TaxID=3416952 RepID=UPI003F53B60D
MARALRTLAAVASPAVPVAATVLVPVGSIEQHGPHLPLDTDTVIATAVATEAARRLTLRDLDVLVAPALAYGSSGEHQDFPGTSSIGTEVLHQVVVELTRSMRTWARRVVLVNAHGGNGAALRGAVRQLTAEGHDVGWVPCATEDVDLHAGRTETSLMLHLAPWHVRLDRAEAGNTDPLEELLPAMVAGGVKAVSPNGVLGDPAGASAEEGAAVLAAMVGDVVRFVNGA